jgi:hypothetical protein
MMLSISMHASHGSALSQLGRCTTKPVVIFPLLPPKSCQEPIITISPVTRPTSNPKDAGRYPEQLEAAQLSFRTATANFLYADVLKTRRMDTQVPPDIVNSTRTREASGVGSHED